MNAVLISIGDELLTGHTVNTNAAWISQQLSTIGIETQKVVMISDEQDIIIEAIEAARLTTSLVIMTGGLGPTKDDVTKHAIADYFQQKLVFNENMYSSILAYFERIDRNVTEAHKKQCYLPEHATLFENSLGTAPGMWLEEEGFVLLSLPGVPYEMQAILNGPLLNGLKNLNKNKDVHYIILQTVGIGETHIEKKINTLKIPSSISVAYLPGIASVKLRISAREERGGSAITELNRLAEMIEDLLDPHVIGRGSLTLPEVVGKMCQEHGFKIASAESCTGGYIAHMITSVPGSSAYFEGSIISYSNSIKQGLLEVSEETLENYGAVSEQTVKEMVAGLIKLTGVDIGIAVSGIAGPSGGTAQKPVGTVWIAVGSAERVATRKMHFAKDRVLNIKYASMYALDMIRLFIENKI